MSLRNKTYCNPLNMPDVGRGMASRKDRSLKQFREIADPDVLYDNGKWYMVASCANIYESEDMVNWTHHRSTCPVFEHYSPSICRYRGKYYVTSCGEELYVADHPLGEYRLLGHFHLSNGLARKKTEDIPNGYPDPDLFSDGDKGLYLYWGCGNAIYGAKLSDDDLSQLETVPKALIRFDPQNVWERCGAYNQNVNVAWTEGACMYFRDGVYYLLYSSAGTQFPSYAMGVYTSDSPLGEFKPQKNNPLLRGADGYVKGSGHGCVVDGPNRSSWAFYTSILGAYHNCERRIGMDRVWFNEEGEMCAEGPTGTPRSAPFFSEEPSGKLLPLSAYCRTAVFSSKEGREGIYAVDESTFSWWQPEDDDLQPYITVGLGAEYMVHGVRIVWREVGLDFDNGILPQPISYVVEGETDGEKKLLYDGSRNDREHCCDYRQFPPTACKRVTIRFRQQREYKLGIIDLTVFGV